MKLSVLRQNGMSRAVGAVLACLLAVSAADAVETCGVCNDAVVMDAALASCFLDQYAEFADKTTAVVAVDLTHCEKQRDLSGIVSAIAPPGTEVIEPDTKFMVTKGQLACIKARLEEQGVAIQDVLKIDLTSCL